MTVRIEVNHEGFREILRSDAVLRDIERRAQAVASAAGPGHGVRSETGQNRVRASVFTETVEAMIGEAKNHRLLRALDAGR